MWIGKLLNVDPNNELTDQEYVAALGQTKFYKALNIFTKIFSIEVISLLLFFGFLLLIVGFLIPPVQSLFSNAEQFAKQTDSENVTTDNLRTIVHTIKEALNTAREFWDKA